MVSTESQQTAEPLDIELVLDALGEERSLDEMFTDAVKLWDAERSDRARLLVRVLHYLKNLAERPMTGAVPRAPRAKKFERSPEEGTLHPKAIEAGLSPDMKLLGKYPVACPACGGTEMVVKQTRDGSRWFLGCPQYSVTGCKGAISYKEFK